MATALATKASRAVFIVGAKRTPIGSFGGKLKALSTTDLGVIVGSAALKAAKVNPTDVDHVVFGNVQQTSKDAAYMTRHIALKVGCRTETPGLSVNRLCGSGFQAVIEGAKDICLEECNIVLAGGTETMSQAPYALRDARFGTRLGQDLVLEDTLWQGLADSHCNLPMGMTAENLADKYKVTRAEAEQYALESQRRVANAQKLGLFDAELCFVPIKSKKGVEEMKVDEYPRPETTLEQMAKLPTVFKKNGTVTAATASGISDGAGAVVLASEAAIAKHSLVPLSRVVAWSVAGVDPSIMGIGPVPAIRELLRVSKLSIQDVALVEINEAFAPQVIACARDLQLDFAKLNVNGGAIALGHPTGMSGARILAHLTHELKRTKQRYAIGSACVGGGMGVAVLLESL